MPTETMDGKKVRKPRNRKRRIALIAAFILILLCAAVLWYGYSHCRFGHCWQQADCETPQICSRCGAEGEAALGHSWVDATCLEPKQCSVCGQTEGEALGHSWTAADCEQPGVCAVCGETGAEPQGHSWAEATCDAPRQCTVCGIAEGEPLEHNWVDGTCQNCGIAAETPVSTVSPVTTASWNVGDVIALGTYEQDGDAGNGAEPIEWIVVDVQGDEALLVSQYVLSCQQYNASWNYLNWETSGIRRWLNSDFYQTAFSAAERQLLRKSTVTADRNTQYLSDPGADTEDLVFLLSIPEAERYLPGNLLRGYATPAAVKDGVRVNWNGLSWYWLRTPGENRSAATYVKSIGTICWKGIEVTCSDGGIRPAVRVQMQ